MVTDSFVLFLYDLGLTLTFERIDVYVVKKIANVH